MMASIFGEFGRIFQGKSELHLSQKVQWLLILLLGVLFIGGGLMTYKGNDAVAIGMEKKSGILTAEQVQISFDSVRGRILEEYAKEGQNVKARDVLLVLDSTDTDIAIAKAKAQIAQIDAQIQGKQADISLGLKKAEISANQTHRGIDQQKAAIERSAAVYQNKQIEYNRKAELLRVGAISQSAMDAAESDLRVAQANAEEDERKLEQLLAGAVDSDSSDTIALPTVEAMRQEAQNQEFVVAELVQKKNQLLAELERLAVEKERLTLRAPEDGKILNVVKRKGEMVEANATAILLESNRRYYDIYLDERQAAHLSEGDAITGYAVGTERPVKGRIRFINVAPGFADLKMSRERGQADLNAFQIRIFLDEGEINARTGMTIEVKSPGL